MQQISIKEFAGRIHDSLSHNPDSKLVFFLGAGCSISSKIPAAGGLVKRWMQRLQPSEPELLQQLALVIADEAPLDSLEGLPAWQAQG